MKREGVCVFTDRKGKAIALALVPIIAINVYAGCKMFKKTSKTPEVQQGAYVEQTVEIIPGETFLELDLQEEIEVVEETDLLQETSDNISIEHLLKETDFSRLERIFKESGRCVENILNVENKSSELYASALYQKLKNTGIADDVIRNELNNIIVYGSNATCVSEEVWLMLFGNLVDTISVYDNVVDYYYPLAKYVHLFSCDLEHNPLFFDEHRVTCKNIQELYDMYNQQVDIRDYFREMVYATQDVKLIEKFNKLLNSGIDLELLLCELENVYVLSMVPTGLSNESWEMLFGNLMQTVSCDENVCIYYYDLAFYVHELWCEFEHELNVFGKYTCDAYKLSLEI